MYSRVLLVAWAALSVFLGASAAAGDVDGKAEAVFKNLGVNPESFDGAVMATARALISGDLTDALGATAKVFQVVTSANEARQYSSFDPVIGFAILGGIIVAALAAWLAYILASARRRRRDIGTISPGLSLENTAAILECLSGDEAKISCLMCVAARPLGWCR